jgi:3-oxoacyl-[acyl-carrier-protein] synthase II
VQRRVVVTGIGMLSPLGLTVKDNWESVKAGRSGIGPITRFDASRLSTQFAGEVRNFDPTIGMEAKEVKRFDTFIPYALAASAEAASA